MLTTLEKDNLIALGIFDANWVITDYFGEDIRKYLVLKCGFGVSLEDTPPTEVIRNAMTVSGELANNIETDPIDTIIVNVAGFYSADNIANDFGFGNFRPNVFIGNGQFLASDGSTLYHFLGEFTRKLAVTDGTINAIFQDGVSVYIGGLFDTVNGVVGFNNVAKLTISLDGSVDAVAAVMDDGFDDEVFCINKIDGVIYAGGNFLNSGATAISRAAKYVTNTWVALSATAIPDQVNVIKERPSTSEIYIGIGHPTLNNSPNGSKLFLLTTGGSPTWEPLQFNEVNETLLDYTFTTNVALTGTAPLIQDGNDLTGITIAKIKLTNQTAPVENGYYTYTEATGNYTTAVWGGWIFNGAVNDIIFNDDSSMMVAGGDFISNATIPSEDMIVVNIDDNNLNNTIEPRAFDLTTTGVINKLYLDNSGTRLFVSGTNIDDLVYTKEGLVNTLHVPGGFAVNNVFNPATFQYETINRFYDYSGLESNSITLLVSDDTIYAAGDFSYMGGDQQEIHSWTEDELFEIKKSTNVKSVASAVIPSYGIGSWYPYYNDVELIIYTRLCSFTG